LSDALRESGPAGFRRTAVVLFACLHLLAIAAFVWTGFPAGRSGVLASAFAIYKNLCGGFRNYTFFAPSVAADVEVVFLLEDAAGRVEAIQLEPANREVGFRYSSLVAACMKNERTRDFYAQSWGALVLSGNPKAEKVTVITRILGLGSMRGYREGQRPRWRTLYVGQFVRRPPGSAR